MGDVIVECAELVQRSGAAAAQRSAPNAARINAIAEEITRSKARPTSCTTQGLKDLSCGTRKTDPMAFIVGTEIYDHLEKVVDRFEDVANEISGIVIEHV